MFYSGRGHFDGTSHTQSAEAGGPARPDRVRCLTSCHIVRHGWFHNIHEVFYLETFFAGRGAYASGDCPGILGHSENNELARAMAVGLEVLYVGGAKVTGSRSVATDAQDSDNHTDLLGGDGEWAFPKGFKEFAPSFPTL